MAASSLTRRIPLPDLPTSAADWRLMGRTARLVLTIPRYAALGLLSAVVGLTTFVASLNLPLVNQLVVGGPLPLEARLEILWYLYPFVGSAYDPLQGGLLVGVAALMGVDVAMVVYHAVEHDLSVREGGAGLVGAVLGTLGAGCAACGSAVLLGLASLLGVSVSATVLPLDGLEFALLALVVILLSIYWIADGMRGGIVRGCPIDP